MVNKPHIYKFLYIFVCVRARVFLCLCVCVRERVSEYSGPHVRMLRAYTLPLSSDLLPRLLAAFVHACIRANATRCSFIIAGVRASEGVRGSE